MTPDDYRTLVDWLYAAGTLGTAAADMRLNERNERAYRSGRTAVPPTVAAYIVGRAALRLTLKGWGDELPPVSAEIRAEILKRLEEARRHAEEKHKAGR